MPVGGAEHHAQSRSHAPTRQPQGRPSPLQLLTGDVGVDRALDAEPGDLGSGPVSATDQLWDLDPTTEPL